MQAILSQKERKVAGKAADTHAYTATAAAAIPGWFPSPPFIPDPRQPSHRYQRATIVLRLTVPRHWYLGAANRTISDAEIGDVCRKVQLAGAGVADPELAMAG
jgi:hypothetical protein